MKPEPSSSTCSDEVTPASAAATSDTATVSILHAVPGLTVDVYANGDAILTDFEPGTITDPLTLPAGDYEQGAKGVDGGAVRLVGSYAETD